MLEPLVTSGCSSYILGSRYKTPDPQTSLILNPNLYTRSRQLALRHINEYHTETVLTKNKHEKYCEDLGKTLKFTLNPQAQPPGMCVPATHGGPEEY